LCKEDVNHAESAVSSVPREEDQCRSCTGIFSRPCGLLILPIGGRWRGIARYPSAASRGHRGLYAWFQFRAPWRFYGSHEFRSRGWTNDSFRSAPGAFGPARQLLPVGYSFLSGRVVTLEATG